MQVAILAMEAEEENLSEEKRLSLGQEVNCFLFKLCCERLSFIVAETYYLRNAFAFIAVANCRCTASSWWWRCEAAK